MLAHAAFFGEITQYDLKFQKVYSNVKHDNYGNPINQLNATQAIWLHTSR